MRSARPSTVVAAGAAGVVALILFAVGAALVVVAGVVVGLWVRLVLFGDGERESRRVEGIRGRPRNPDT